MNAKLVQLVTALLNNNNPRTNWFFVPKDGKELKFTCENVKMAKRTLKLPLMMND
uniref:Uncharacterized protein n=1 Tax=Romanomermis culicivorax TaxID=13658 RepID=A0A915J269_ROMCU